MRKATHCDIQWKEGIVYKAISPLKVIVPDKWFDTDKHQPYCVVYTWTEYQNSSMPVQDTHII